MNTNRLVCLHVLVILMTMNVKASLLEYNVPSCKKAYLACKAFNIEKYCYIKGNVKAESGTVGDSMIAANVFIKSLKVGDFLVCKQQLVCEDLIVGSDVKVAELKAKECTVMGSMIIKYKGLISEKLSVGGLLFCYYLVNPNETTVDNIKAEHSDFGHVSIKKSSQSRFCSTLRVNSYILDLSHDKTQYKQSEFMNCTIKSIFAGESQIIVLCGRTMVTGDITFEEGTSGFVFVSSDSCINGKVINGTVSKFE